MPKRALVEHRPWLLASLAASLSYFFLADETVPGLYLMAWKGAGVACLAAYAWHRASGRDGLLIGSVMAFGAAGDVGVELSLEIGAIFFAIGHLFAIALFFLNRRSATSSSQRMAGMALVILTPVLAGLIAYPAPGWALATAYSAVLGVMAGLAWTSRFTRYRVGLGAVLFVVSDLLIFSREAGVVGTDVANWLIWPLYYGGQFLIATGVVQRIRADAGET